MSSSQIVDASLIAVVVLACIAITNLIQSLLTSQRLHRLSLEVMVHDPDTFEHLEAMRCQGCKSTSKVHRYQYGKEANTLLLCSLCSHRLQGMVRASYQSYLATHPKEQLKESYVHVRTRRPIPHTKSDFLSNWNLTESRLVMKCSLAPHSSIACGVLSAKE